MESGIQAKESGTPLTIGIQNPSSTDKDPESSSWNTLSHGVESRIQECLGFDIAPLNHGLSSIKFD